MGIKRKLLIVEDNIINRMMLEGILEPEYEVLSAEHGQEALDILKEHRNEISLILSDIMMPVMDGYTFMDRLREDPELSLIPVIVMTQGNSEEDELAVLDHGAADYLPKPYRPKIILHRVANLIKLRESAAMINQLQYDRLTRLYNKEFFFKKVQERLAQDPNGEYVIVGSNIENFKLVNDVFGRKEGDRVIQEVADIIAATIGSDGICGRFEADRFVMLQRKDKEQADRRNVNFNMTGVSSQLKNVTMRWGIYEISDRTVPVDSMCDRAFMAASSIKNQYSRFFAVYDDSLRNKMLREQSITSVMDKALEEKQFLVYFQPKYDLRTGKAAGSEALVRWIHPEWGFMSPGEFIPIFERNGFIPKLDQYVWERICMRLKQWKDTGCPLHPVSVNVSRADVFQVNLKETLVSLTKKYDVDPALLHIEITESAYAETPNQIIDTVSALREAGFIVEMDDFGSGYSSLNMLSSMSLDIVKLDMKFITNELAKPDDKSLVGDLIAMAHRIKLKVVAEGVETKEQVERLKTLDCDYVQGYYFAKPMPADEYEALIRVNEPKD
ncbi:MAG: EAL domain-containing protein [Eubacteriales bacterium]|nr:EAL domain-containing protein [Eubacteriales bacterium]